MARYEQVLAIVGRVLRLEVVDPAADFFDLGATSMSLVQIVELVRAELGADIWITDAFDAADVDEFATAVVERAPAVDAR